MDDVVKRRVRTEVMSWKRRELAAPDSKAPLLLSLMACSSPASRLMRITLKALWKQQRITTASGDALLTLLCTQRVARSNNQHVQ